MIELNKVTKKYLTQVALDEVSISLPQGKIIGIVGENGSGKSTTLKLMAGLIQPSKGTIMINGENVTRRISAQVAYLSELDAYYPFYTVQETIDYFASQFEDFDRDRAKEILEFMRLDPNKKVKELSKGNRGRLKILIVLSRKVPIILMDEPLSGLDPMVRDSIIKGLLSFVDIEKQTVIITTHEIREIEPLLDVVIALKSGKILEMTEVEEIRSIQQLSLVEWMKKVYE